MTGIAVYVNPKAGAGRAGRLWQRLAAGEPRLARADVIAAPDADAGIAALDAALARGPRRVIAVGGDGTANLVANRLLESAAASEVVFALIPAGTGSDLARSLGLPRRPADAARRALDSPGRPIDAIEVRLDDGARRFSVNIASIGISGAVAAAANTTPNRGVFTYLRVTVGALLRYQPVPIRLLLDGELFFEGPFFAAAFANGQSFGGGMRVAPDARLDDGLADLVVVPPVPRWALPLRLPQFLRGHHVRLPFVRVGRGRNLRVELLEPSPTGGAPAALTTTGWPPFELDGETLKASSGTFSLRPSALRAAS